MHSRFLLTIACCFAAQVPFVYPPARRADTVDDYSGIKVADPYRWLEQRDSPETNAWIEAENKLTFGYLRSLPGRDAIRRVVDRMYAITRYPGAADGAGVEPAGGRVFYLRQEQGQNQPVLYVRGKDGQSRVLLDPNSLSADGTVALNAWQPSRDGKWLVYGLSGAGSDWQKLRVRNVETGSDLPEVLDWVKFSSPRWLPDDSGFSYTRFPQPKSEAALTGRNTDQKLYLHRLNTSQSADQLLYERPDHPEWLFLGDFSTDGRYAVVTAFRGSSSESVVFYRDVKAPGETFTPLISEFEAQYNLLEARRGTLYFQTTDAAPRGRIIAVNLEKPQRANWKEIVPEREATLDGAVLAGDSIILNYMKDAASSLRIHSIEDGKEKNLPLPGLGTAGLPIRADGGTVYYKFTSFTSPQMLYEYHFSSGRTVSFERTRSPLDAGEYETKQVFYHSKDGTRVPMFLVYRKGLTLDGNNPTLLHGYGGFDVSNTPAFRPIFGAWLELGGVFALANLRGGGEYGREWHEAGTKLRKQNVFDDFISAAEWLIANKYTSPKKLAIYGASNGGLLVGACLNQRPDLFGAAIPAVGVMDMLRFHKFTIGAAWTTDYGSAENPEEFKALRAYSPLHNIHEIAFPPTLILTSDHDDRVVPAHSFKYAAAVQHAQQGSAPVLIRIETSAGHGAGKPVSKQAEEISDMLAFLLKSLDVAPPAGTNGHLQTRVGKDYDTE